MKICQIVGYKNVGKTTLINALIQHFTANGLKVGALKHHGHGGDPYLREATDSSHYLTSGATISAVQGESVTELIIPNPTFEALLSVYQTAKIDVLLIEGFKHADYRKIALLQSSEDLVLLDELTNVIATGVWEDGLNSAKGFVFSVPNVQVKLNTLADIIMNEGC